MTDASPSQPAQAREAYYQLAKAWAYDAHGSLRRSRDAAWAVAALAILVAGLNAAALLGLGPIRRGAPFAIAVAEQRGQVMEAHALQPGALQRDPTFAQSMLARYVTAREGFDAPNVSRDYRLVELLSDAQVRAAYAQAMGATSGVSPLTLYPPSAHVVVEVQSVSLLDAGHAIVRFATTRADVQGAQPQVQQAQIAFTFTRAPMRQLERFDNPLGFLVSAYSKSPI